MTLLAQHVGHYYRGTTAERNALTPPASSMCWDTDESKWYIWDGAAWEAMGGNKSRIFLYDSAGGPLGEYPATSSGLDSASGAASAGDVVWLPARTITGDHTLAAGAHYIGQSEWACILTGEITTGVDTTLEVCSVIRTANDGNDLKGIVAGAASGMARVRAVSVTCTQNGAGGAFAISAEGTGDIEVKVSSVYGNSIGGVGYGARRGIGAGNLYLDATRTRGSTAECSE